jgi:hypothetical protein
MLVNKKGSKVYGQLGQFVDCHAKVLLSEVSPRGKKESVTNAVSA